MSSASSGLADANSRKHRVLVLLSQAETPLTSSQLAHELGLLPAMAVGRAQTKINNALSGLEGSGLVERVGKATWQRDGQKKGQPSILWGISAQGRAELNAAQHRTSVRVVGMHLRDIHHAAAEAALTVAAEKFDSSTPHGLRDPVIAALRMHRCSLHEIGEVFGLTRERVRQITGAYGVERTPSLAQVYQKLHADADVLDVQAG